VIRINILTNNIAANSRAFNYPLLLFRRHLFKHRYNVKLFFNDSFLASKKILHENLLDCDVFGINSKSIHYIRQNNSEYLYEFLTKAKNEGRRILWFDTYDSTASTEFDVLPYVDLYLKNQILRDKQLYLDDSNRVRFYVRKLNEIYNITQEHDKERALPEPSHLKKIQISWNSCYENYNENRHGIFNKIYQRYLRPNSLWQLKTKIEFCPPKSNRSNIFSCRVFTDYKWDAIRRHREDICRLVRGLGGDTKKMSLKAFFEEMENSMISIGPFGLGEITLRDYEIILSGSTLIKPNISYVNTFPNLFRENETYVPVKWDLSDLIDTIEYLAANCEIREEIGTNAQEVYREYISGENRENLFSDHFEKIICSLE